MKKLILIFLLGIHPGTLLAQPKNYSVGPAPRDNSSKAELASFRIAKGYTVSLFASEQDGIANPIAMRWGPKGRLWVLCSLVYPQAIPSEVPNDKLFILEDSDHDGQVDTTLVFADRLDMPTGFALGNGGVYLGQGQDLVFLADTNGDDRADHREVVLSGFGTGDTHQNINSFTWSPGGELLFCQGLHNFSRVETPWGIVRMNEHGVWRLRPRRMQLHAFRGCSGQNPWGLSHGHWGQPFAKSNGNAVSELLPVMVHTENRHPPLDIGGTRIKSMICEIIDSPALPDDLQGNIVIAGYFAHLIDRLRITSDGAGHRGELLDPLWTTDHQSFRPVDIQTGPDGALYIADWYNPIIGHYQASLRHPDRDKTHGRIWRLTAEGKRTVRAPNYHLMPTRELLESLCAATLKERERLRIILSDRYADSERRAEIHHELANWISSFDPLDPHLDRQIFEALCLHEWFEIINSDLLERLLSARDPLARSYATRIVGRWHDRLPAPLKYLRDSVADAHPRVRLEAVVAASQLMSTEAMETAVLALNAPTDRFIEAALRQCAHALQRWWFTSLKEGQLAIKDTRHLAFLLDQTSGRDAAGIARTLLEDTSLKPSSPAFPVLAMILATQGSVEDLDWLVAKAHGDLQNSTPVLSAMQESASIRELKPRNPNLDSLLTSAVTNGTAAQQIHALHLIGYWQLLDLRELVITVIFNTRTSPEVRIAALRSTSHFPKIAEDRIDDLSKLTTLPGDIRIRHAALDALTAMNVGRAAQIAAEALIAAGPSDPLEPYLIPFLTRSDGALALSSSLQKTELSLGLRARIRGALGAAGLHSAHLEKALEPPSEESSPTIGLPVYSQQWIDSLAAEARKDGDSERGSKVYHRDSLACTKCHVISGQGMDFGPELTAVGAGLPLEIIIESVVWPRRQIKEGYLSTSITTRDGLVVSGHLKHEDSQRIIIEDAITRRSRMLAPSQVQHRQDAGTIMPPGLTAQLSREELRDLVRFLSERKGK
ncbi:MAG: hypothetical protein CMP29_05190 [Roseibacillus sp.]|nr:hypothetical protein [Roseibacillus sp.]